MNDLPDTGARSRTTLDDERGRRSTRDATAPTQGATVGDVLEGLLTQDEHPPPPQGRNILDSLFGVTDPDASIADIERIKQGVYRVRYEAGGTRHSVIAKRFSPAIGHRNYVLVTRWLPVAELQDAGPLLLRTVAEPLGRFVWHVYEDFGEASLDSGRAKTDHVEQSVGLIASLHIRFADHPLLGECRLWGGDLGMSFYHSSVVDALRAVEALRRPPIELGSKHRAACDSLLNALRQMLEDEDRRRSLLAEHGGPETLLHGDLWRQNVLLVRSADGELRPRLIDWDHVAVGRVSYDLSTFLSRFPKRERLPILAFYRAEVSAAGWQLPDNDILNELFATAEQCRIANRVIWPAIQIRFDSRAAWAFEQLIEVCRWFDQMEPILP